MVSITASHQIGSGSNPTSSFNFSFIFYLIFYLIFNLVKSILINFNLKKIRLQFQKRVVAEHEDECFNMDQTMSEEMVFLFGRFVGTEQHNRLGNESSVNLRSLSD